MIHFRAATSDDNSGLIELTAKSGMTGDIGLRIDRNPDFFSLLKMRGPTKVFLAEENKKIIGAICVSLKKIYVGGEVLPLQYIGDFKVAEEYRNRGIGLKLCDEVANYVISKNADLAFLNVSKGNTKPFSFFTNRPGIPDFDNIGIFNIYQIIGKKMQKKPAGLIIDESNATDEVLKFLNHHYSAYQLAPVVTKEELNETKLYTIRHNQEIIAVMGILDTMSVKQNIIMSLSWKMKWLLKLANSYCSITGLSQMPSLHKPVKMLYVNHFAVARNNKAIVKLLINYSRGIAYEKSYSYISIALHEKDTLNRLLAGLPKFTFKSVGMLLSVKNNRELINKVKSGVPYVDYSLV